MFLVALLIVTTSAFAQKKSESVTVNTTIQCSQCEKRILKNIPFEKGVKDVKVDLDKKTVWVEFDPSKTSALKIRQAISKLGYDADDVKRDQKAYDKLPTCCREDSGMGKH